MRRMMMLAVCAATLAAGQAHAGVYGDDLSKCLVAKTTDADRQLLIQWIFSAMSVNPNLKGVVTVPEAQREATSKDAANLLETLLLTTCRESTTAALKYEGTNVIETSFGVLGQVAMRGLMSDPKVTGELERMGSYIHEDRWAQLAKETGIPVKPPAGK
jgi:hypothetical protein